MKLLMTVLLGSTLLGCGGGDSTTTPDVTPTPESYVLSGDFQKGPFVIGSRISIQEFNEDLIPSGRTFQTSTISNTGSYSMDILLDEDVVEVSAQGYYFNEITGSLSSSTLHLSALASVSQNENINVNILTHLSKKRIQTLVASGVDFSTAKTQTENEVQALFPFISERGGIDGFDRMNISESGDNNAYLLVISSILQNINTATPQFSQFIEHLAQDISDNGVVDDNTLIESIDSSAKTIDLSLIRSNLETYYSGLAEALSLPDFELLINRAPVADAGTDISAYVNTVVTLNGNNSSDIDNDTLTYSWLFVSSPEGSVATLTNADTISPSLIFDIQGRYQVSLTVSDGELSSNTDIVNIATNNRAPDADAGADFSIVVGEEITLNGSSSYDPDGDRLIYTWGSIKDYNTGHDVDIHGSGMTFEAGVVTPPIPIDSYYYVTDPVLPKIIFKLIVTDPNGFSSEDEVTVTYTANLIDNNDGTVSDGFGTMWEQSSSSALDESIDQPGSGPGYAGYSKARAYCSELIIDEYSDWRLPNKNELFRLVDVGSPSINNNFFQDTAMGRYATDSKLSLDYYGTINFSSNGAWGLLDGSIAYARCAR